MNEKSSIMTPKRKRPAPCGRPQIDTIIHDKTRVADPESPRSKVAENLLQLRIHDNLSSASDAQCHVSKKRQLQDGAAGDLYEMSEAVQEGMKVMVTPPKDFSPIDTMDGVFEIGETPGAYNSFSRNRFPSSPPISPSPSPSPLKLDDDQSIADSEEDEEQNLQTVFGSGRGRDRLKPRRNSAEYRSISHTSAGRQARSDAAGGGFEIVIEENTPAAAMRGRRKVRCGATPITTPPPPTPVTSPGEGEVQQPILANAAAVRMMSIPTLPLPDIPSLCSPTGTKRKSPPMAPTSAPFQDAAPPAADGPADSESMTWSEKEITGHLWNPDIDRDDDGEGINGIGFRPTAAIEWKRREGRKRQISDWRAREAKEERKRRFERRKRGSAGACSSSSSGNSGGSVKFNDTAESSNVAVDGDQEGKRVRVRFAEAT